MESKGYNERLFAGGIRGRLHQARFVWFTQTLDRLKCSPESILELGCFDGKLLDYLPERPARYVGFDANWEGGLDAATKRWGANSAYSFRLCDSPEQMHLSTNDRFDIAVAMETLEHIPPYMLDEYLQRLAEHTDRYIFITVPNEKGVVFIFKWLLKKLLGYRTEDYTWSELGYATLGRMEKVRRRDHKGFDYSGLISHVAKYFEIQSVVAIPFAWLPTWASFNVGIVGRRRNCV